MDADSFWKSRTVREAMDQGYTFLRLTCARGRITDYPLPLLLQRRGVTRDTFLGNIGFKCQKCGSTSPGIGVTYLVIKAWKYSGPLHDYRMSFQRLRSRLSCKSMMKAIICERGCP